MLPKPQYIDTRFGKELMKKGIPVLQQLQYKKWLQYCQYFCSKYNHIMTNKHSLAPFFHELQSNNQSAWQQKQASEAVSNFHQIERQREEYDSAYLLKNITIKISTKNEISPSLTNSDWRAENEALNAEMQSWYHSP